MGRFGYAEETGAIVLFMASDICPFLNGSVVLAGGDYHLPWSFATVPRPSESGSQAVCCKTPRLMTKTRPRSFGALGTLPVLSRHAQQPNSVPHGQTPEAPKLQVNPPQACALQRGKAVVQ
jgi:hypothetical protein